MTLLAPMLLLAAFGAPADVDADSPEPRPIVIVYTAAVEESINCLCKLTWGDPDFTPDPPTWNCGSGAMYSINDVPGGPTTQEDGSCSVEEQEDQCICVVTDPHDFNLCRAGWTATVEVLKAPTSICCGITSPQINIKYSTFTGNRTDTHGLGSPPFPKTFPKTISGDALCEDQASTIETFIEANCYAANPAGSRVKVEWDFTCGECKSYVQH